jgi:uncharacterized membrane protein YbhN (UPF0104 family)
MDSRQPKRKRVKSWKLFLGLAVGSWFIILAGKDLLEVVIRENNFWFLVLLVFFVLLAGYLVGNGTELD